MDMIYTSIFIIYIPDAMFVIADNSCHSDNIRPGGVYIYIYYG